MEITTKLQNIPLVKSVEINSLPNGGSVFFGVGLMTSKQIGIKLPFDILGMFFASEIIRHALNFKSTTVIIADTHAASNQIFPEEKINALANKVENQLTRIIRNFALQNFQIIRATEFHQDTDFRKILTPYHP